ncbi:MAG: hypothetical protein WDM81_16005 [Rhizomicrobium sp.]
MFLALGSAGLAVATPHAVGWAGVMLLAAIGAVASLFLFAVWPKDKLSAADARRVAEAAARANIAWAITATDGAVVDCNDVYRRMSGAKEGESAPPPELALAGEPSAAVLYRLTRGAADGVPREESFAVGPGIELVAAVRPLSNGQTAWWFTPRLSSPSVQAAPAKPIAAPAPVAAPAAIGDIFRDAPVGVAFAGSDGRIVDAQSGLREILRRRGRAGGTAVRRTGRERRPRPRGGAHRAGGAGRAQRRQRRTARRGHRRAHGGTVRLADQRRTRHPLSGGRVRAEGAGNQIRPEPEDAGGRPACRRRGA